MENDNEKSTDFEFQYDGEIETEKVEEQISEETQPPKKEVIAVISLILGIVAVVLGFVGLGAIFGIVAIVLGIISLVKKFKKGKPIAGIITGAVGIVGSFISIVILILGLIFGGALFGLFPLAMLGTATGFGHFAEDTLEDLGVDDFFGESIVDNNVPAVIDESVAVDEKDWITYGDKSFTNGGEVLNIATWNEEAINYMSRYYPGYQTIDSTTGMIDGVTIRWIIVPADGYAYQDNLDDVLEYNVGSYDPIDMFLVEPGYGKKYIDSDYVLTLSDIGISESEANHQWEYMKDLGRNEKGELVASGFNACTGVMIYNKAIAYEVFGTADPDVIQANVSNMDDFYKFGDILRSAGYRITATPYDYQRLFIQNSNEKMVQNGSAVVTEDLNNWSLYAKNMLDTGMTTNENLWGGTWSSGFDEGNNVFCYFGPDWLLNYCMNNYSDYSVAYNGGWAVCPGPQPFYWGGTMLCVANGTDNYELCADIIRTLTMDDNVMTKMYEGERAFINNSEVMQRFAYDSSYGNTYLGGQNPIPAEIENSEKLRIKNATKDDTDATELFNNIISRYFSGYASLDDAYNSYLSEGANSFPD